MRVFILILKIIILSEANAQERSPFKKFEILNSHAKNNNTIIIDLSKFSEDSVSINFPYAGSQTTIGLYSDYKYKKQVAFISYMNWSDKNENRIAFHRKDLRNLYCKLNSCHWKGRFRIIVK